MKKILKYKYIDKSGKEVIGDKLPKYKYNLSDLSLKDKNDLKDSDSKNFKKTVLSKVKHNTYGN